MSCALGYFKDLKDYILLIGLLLCCGVVCIKDLIKIALHFVCFLCKHLHSGVGSTVFKAQKGQGAQLLL